MNAKVDFNPFEVVCAESMVKLIYENILKPKCFDTKKAERYFKERGVKYQLIDVSKFGMSKGEFNNVKQAVGGIQNLLDENSKEKELITLIKYLASEDQEE